MKLCHQDSDGVFHPCPAMDEVLPPEANGMGKGMHLVHVTNFKTGEDRTIGVTYRAKARTGGILFNVCPWCGEPILWEKQR